MTIKTLTGTCTYAAGLRGIAPSKYLFAPPGYGIQPGRFVSGPFDTATTTLYLLDGDDGSWFREAVLSRGGSISEGIIELEPC